MHPDVVSPVLQLFSAVLLHEDEFIFGGQKKLKKISLISASSSETGMLLKKGGGFTRCSDVSACAGRSATPPRSNCLGPSSTCSCGLKMRFLRRCFYFQERLLFRLFLIVAEETLGEVKSAVLCVRR